MTLDTMHGQKNGVATYLEYQQLDRCHLQAPASQHLMLLPYFAFRGFLSCSM